MKRTTTWTVLALLVVAGVAGVLQAQDEKGAGFAVFSGRVTFQRYCASCHGAEAHGDGNVAQYLKIPPSDLTRIQAENGGEFPADEVREFIDGRRPVAGHGTREMPVWGEVFQSSLADPKMTNEEGEERAERIIGQLVAYLESIQVDE